MFSVHIAVGAVHIEMQTDNAYPDVAHDLTNRARELVNHTLMAVNFHGWQPFDLDIDLDDEDEDEGETPNISPGDFSV